MALDVIGAGFGRTGTMSLKLALEQLGFMRCYHMMEVAQNPHHLGHWEQALRADAVDWDSLFEGYRAAVDWPVCSYWRALSTHYPQAKLILTVRDPRSWYRSVRSTIYPSSMAGLESDDAGRRRYSQWIWSLIWEGTFDGRVDDEAHAIRVFEEHNAAVMAEVPQQRLLVYRLGEGWTPLCRFLGVPEPDAEFPNVNSTEEFQERWRGIRGPEK
jgi:hypothetical protein